MNRFANPYWAVLRSYLQRPLFRWLAVALLCYPLQQIAYQWVAEFSATWMVLRELLAAIWSLCLPVALAVSWMAHVREQLEGPRLIPNFLRPHLRVAAVTFTAMVAVFPLLTCAIELATYLIFRMRMESFVYSWWNMGQCGSKLLIALTLMVAAALWASFRSPWVALLLAPVVLIANMTGADPSDWYANLYYCLLSRHNYLHVTWTLVAAVTAIPLLLDAIGLLILRRRLVYLASADLQPAEEREVRASESGERVRSHVTAMTLWQRAQRRRSAGLGGASALGAGVLVAAVLLATSPLMRDRYGVGTQLRVSLILATILPAAVVTCIWAERWPRMAAELLLPSSRRRFVAETMLAMGIDLLQFWLALAAAAVLPLILVPVVPVSAASLVGRFLASAVLQAVAFAAIAWGMRLRSWPAVAILLGPALGAMAGPFMSYARRPALASAAVTLEASVLVAVAAVAISGVAYRRWVVGNWA